MSFLPRLLLLVIGGVSLVFPAPVFSQSPTESGPVPSIRVKQGDVFFFYVDVENGTATVQGRFRDRAVPFFKTERPEQFGALIGVDLADPPSKEDLQVEISSADGTVERRHYPVEVLPVHFATQELTVPKNYVDLDEETAKRAEEEQEKILKSLNKVTARKFWEGRFMMPVEGKIAGSFGLRRIMNGQPRSPHSGEDINAPRGTNVLATNEGLVALVGEFFFSGKSVILDHGLGLYSMYFHLDAVAVAEGEKIRKGAVIGKLGATGRATGPHLHWGTRLNGARVNPLSILNLE
ncbi:MAG: M23 family metallopeptidase [Nitrospirae bacterium]|nr:M23 family metallopeptidase [Nitrospirota bacterium]